MPTAPMAETLRGHLLAAARAFCAARFCKFSTLGQWSNGDHEFFTKLEAGSSKFTVHGYDKAMGWMSDNWPAGAKWPKGVPRPARSAAA